MVRLGGVFSPPLLFLDPFFWKVLLSCLVLVFLIYLKNTFKYLKCVQVDGEQETELHVPCSNECPHLVPKVEFRHHFLRKPPRPLTQVLSCAHHVASPQL